MIVDKYDVNIRKEKIIAELKTSESQQERKKRKKNSYSYINF